MAILRKKAVSFAGSSYRRFAGRGRRPGQAMTVSSLYAAEDHLLVVDLTAFTERYRRFYFRDVQAISIRKTPRGSVLALVSLAVALGFAGLGAMLFPAPDAIGFWVFVSLASLFALVALGNVLLGPSCRVSLHTAVHVEELPSLRRVRQAERALDVIVARIDAAQGPLVPAAG